MKFDSRNSIKQNQILSKLNMTKKNTNQKVSPKKHKRIREEDFLVNDSSIHVGVWPGKKRTVICLHGLSGNLHSMESFANLLSKAGHKVISYDLKGRGHSGKPKIGYGFMNHIEDLNQLVQHYNLKEFILLGHSFGCMIALRYALLFPEKISGMILIDGGGLLTVKKRIQILKVLKQSFDRLDVVYRSQSEYFNLLKNSPLVPKWTQKIEDYFGKELHPIQNGYLCHMPKYVMLEELKEMGGAIDLKNVILQFLSHPIEMGKRMILNKRLDFESIHTPTLIMRATKMNLFPNDDLLPKESFDEMIRRIPNAKGIEINSNHYGILFDEIKERDKTILNFINELN
ncbi:alpha/beta hydrolase [Leptospira limi]|uniref:Alpha/beta hydrolase n=1 Tax=Leptospira limi TaxID=2950023 RepID=A0ABT3M133_9LEPT|nr:alpha/beta hydrolase [Leptospira limi]MCW7463684.1 alpha/beta hydrolase [Leptospira limi]